MKFCPTCETKLPNSSFYKNKSTASGLANECKKCSTTRKKANPNTQRNRGLYDRRSLLRNRYGITEAQYESLLEKQRGCCAVCRRPAGEFKIGLAVDHDHHSGEIRGLLCTHCNRRIIGRNRRELGGVEILRQAAQYLEGPYTGWFAPPKKKKSRRRKRAR